MEHVDSKVKFIWKKIDMMQVGLRCRLVWDAGEHRQDNCRYMYTGYYSLKTYIHTLETNLVFTNAIAINLSKINLYWNFIFDFMIVYFVMWRVQERFLNFQIYNSGSVRVRMSENFYTPQYFSCTLLHIFLITSMVLSF